MFMGSVYSPPELGAISLKKLTANFKAGEKVFKKGKAFYKRVVRPDGTAAEVQITEAEALGPGSGGSGRPAWVLPAFGALLALTLVGVFRKRRS